MKDKVKRRTIRLSPMIDNELEILAKKNHTSVNQLVVELIKYNINQVDKVDETINLSKIIELLELTNKNIEDLQRKCNWLNDLTKQIFVNSGFVKNGNAKNDQVYIDFVNNWYKNKYEEKYNS